ncbi:MAG: metal ABC transporter solute-binding protein, Zn/Mn family [Stellaceae bacterium]
MKAWPALAVASLLAAAAPVSASPLAIVAAENFYGDVAQQIGGNAVMVTSILANPDQDPHLFELSPSAARAIADARLVIANGAGYDPWMDKLLGATRGTDRRSIVVAELVGKKPGDNPHIWYDPGIMLAAAKALARDLSAVDAAHAADYRGRLEQFEDSLRPIETKIAALRRRFAGTPVTATEPILGALFAALDLNVRGEAFQRAIMNDTEPSASGIAAFETDLKTHRVRLLVHNSQVSGPVVRRMVALARAERIPVLGVTETEPRGKDYQSWMLGVLDAVDLALSE